MISVRDLEPCVYCPRLCRHACPVAVGSAREAATPTAMMTGPFLAILGTIPREEAAAYASLCAGCGACTDVCLTHRPVTELLSAARETLLEAPEPAPLGLVEGAGGYVAVECDGRSWARALAGRLGEPVARFVTQDHLGEPLLDFKERFAAHARDLRDRLAGRTLVVADGGCLRVARAAGLSVKHLGELVPPPGDGPVFHACQGPRLEGEGVPGALACCGNISPLLDHHPGVAREVTEALVVRLGAVEVRTADARCGAALRAAGGRVADPLSTLLGEP